MAIKRTGEGTDKRKGGFIYTPLKWLAGTAALGGVSFGGYKAFEKIAVRPQQQQPAVVRQVPVPATPSPVAKVQTKPKPVAKVETKPKQPVAKVEPQAKPKPATQTVRITEDWSPEQIAQLKKKYADKGVPVKIQVVKKTADAPSSKSNTQRLITANGAETSANANAKYFDSVNNLRSIYPLEYTRFGRIRNLFAVVMSDGQLFSQATFDARGSWDISNDKRIASPEHIELTVRSTGLPVSLILDVAKFIRGEDEPTVLTLLNLNSNGPTIEDLEPFIEDQRKNFHPNSVRRPATPVPKRFAPSSSKPIAAK